jgi:hypothetical protein
MPNEYFLNKEEYEEWKKERDALFLNPNLEEAQAYWERHEYPTPERFDVPLATVHKARLQWLEATNAMLAESMKWLQDNGYETTFKGAPPLTPEQRDSDRVAIGRKPLGEG